MKHLNYVVFVEKSFLNVMSPKYVSREKEMSDTLAQQAINYTISTIMHHSLCSQEEITAIGNV